MIWPHFGSPLNASVRNGQVIHNWVGSSTDLALCHSIVCLKQRFIQANSKSNIRRSYTIDTSSRKRRIQDGCFTQVVRLWMLHTIMASSSRWNDFLLPKYTPLKQIKSSVFFINNNLELKTAFEKYYHFIYIKYIQVQFSKYFITSLSQNIMVIILNHKMIARLLSI